MSAKESTLGDLHLLLTDGYRAELQRQMAAGEVSPALLTSISKFLKDNGIQAEVGDESMNGLKSQSADLLKFPFDALKEARGV